MGSTRSTGTADPELGDTQFRCEWCDLPREDCSCDSPDYVEYGRCGECGLWKPLWALELRDKPGTVVYNGCKGGCPV